MSNPRTARGQPARRACVEKRILPPSTNLRSGNRPGRLDTGNVSMRVDGVVAVPQRAPTTKLEGCGEGRTRAAGRDFCRHVPFRLMISRMLTGCGKAAGV